MKLKKKELRLAENVTDEEFLERYCGHFSESRRLEEYSAATNRGDDSETTHLRSSISNAHECPRPLAEVDSPTPSQQEATK